MAFQLNDDAIKDLLQEAFKKIESKATQDSKLLGDMNNALNWILSLTTVMFVIYMRAATSYTGGLDKLIFYGSRVSFGVLIAILILHKIALLYYEKAKGNFIESLRLHYLQLKFDISTLKGKYDFDTMAGIEDFVNNFEKGSFGAAAQTPSFTSYPGRIKKYAVIIRVSFWAGLVIFCLYFSGVIMLLGK